MSAITLNLNEGLDRARMGLSILQARLPLVVQNPRAYPREAMTLAMTAAFLIVFLMLVFFLVSGIVNDFVQWRRLRTHRRPGSIVRRVGLVLGVLVVLAVLTGVATTLRGAEDRCARCHAIAPSISSWRSSVHKEVACVRCHARPGMLGGLEWALQRFACSTGSAGSVRSSTAASTCLSCHREAVAAVVVADGIRVSHAEPLAAGMSCMACHNDVGHAPVKSAATTNGSNTRRAMMSNCVSCHDGKRAPAGCPVCHTVSPADAPSTARDPQAPIPTRTTCTGCHPAKVNSQCVNCHGLELPHPSAWPGQHARESAKDPALCAKCHETAAHNQPCGCHTETNVHGTFSQWFPTHQDAAIGSWPGGCKCHDAHFCEFCHPQVPKTESTGLTPSNLAPRKSAGSKGGTSRTPDGYLLGGGLENLQ